MEIIHVAESDKQKILTKLFVAFSDRLVVYQKAYGFGETPAP